MKFALSLLSIALLVETGHACLGDLDLVRRYKSGALYTENFDQAKHCTTAPQNYAALHEEFRTLKERFPYDLMLSLYHARTKMASGSPHFLEGLNEFCQLIYVHTPTDEYLCVNLVPELLGYIHSLVIAHVNVGDQFQKVRNHVKDLKSFYYEVKNPSQKLTRNQRARQKGFMLETQMIDALKGLYGLLKQNHAEPCGDALAFIIRNTLDIHGLYDTDDRAIKALYEMDKNPSDHLTYAYAQYLKKAEKYEQAMTLLTPLVGTHLDPDLPFQSPEACNLLVVAGIDHYRSTRHDPLTDKEKQKDFLRGQLTLLEELVGTHNRQNIIYMANMTSIYLELGDHEKARQAFSKIKSLPQKALSEVGLKRHRFEALHQVLAEKTEDIELSTELLLARQAKALAKNKIIASFIKSHQAALNRAAQTPSRPSFDKPSTTPTASERKTDGVHSKDRALSSSSRGLSSHPQDNGPTFLASDTSHEAKKSAKEALSKEKKKTRRPSQPHPQAQGGPQEKPQGEQPSTLYIEDVTTNKQAVATFYRLFSKYLPDIRSDKKVTISLHEVRSLFKALGQNYDPKAGKGSHKKGTLKFEETPTPLEEQMVILTKSAYLKPYQIKKLRTAFLKSGVVPKDAQILHKLRQEGLL
ncbi:MAG: hypothetical protein ACK5YY_06965 [Alphaproteobacteria bacterium]